MRWILVVLKVFLLGNIAANKSCGMDRQCVPYNRCQEGLMVEGHFYPDRSRTLVDEQSCHYMEKCCDVNETLSSPPPNNVSVNFPSCGGRQDLWYYLRPLGYKQQESKFGEFPWLVAIFGSQGYLCSGALISPVAVLTAAHCVSEETAPNLRLVAGEWDVAVQLEPLDHQTRLVSELLVHPNYTKTPQVAHNLAVLFVERQTPFEMAAHVQLICLPPPKMIYNYTQCYAAGWQQRDFGGAETLPKRWTLYALPRDQCRAKLRLAILGRRYASNDTLLCAGGDKGDFVCGDMGMSGVPLMCPLPGGEDRFALAGLLARAGRCDGPQLLGIYTNIQYYRQWIDQKLRERDVDIRQYMV